jgi:hypothetical protein
MIEATQMKLREAQFFLRRLFHEARQADINEPEAFTFYLSAFLSAARSVTFALQYEEKKRYDAWFPSWLNNRTNEERQFLSCLKDQRNKVQKQGGAQVSTEWEFVSLFEYDRGNHGHPAFGFHWVGAPGVQEPTFGRRVYSFELSGSVTEVTGMCNRYPELLDQLVREFIEESTKQADA